MAKVYDEIDDKLHSFIAAQHVFFVATAPVAADGLINLSPKGSDTFRVLGPRRVAYLDLTGSGIETIAHLRENGRIVVMFCAFEGPPNILRLHGRGSVALPGAAEFEELKHLFPEKPGVRSIIVVDLDRISDSCGYAVPHMRFEGERDLLDLWAVKKGDDLTAYRAEKNAASVDGLPGLS